MRTGTMSPSSQTMSSPRMQQQQHRRRGQRHNLPGAAMGTLPPCCIPAGLFLVLWITVTLQIATAIVGLHYSLVVVQQSPRYFTYKQSRLKSSFLVGVEAFVVDQPYRYNRRMVVQFHSRVLKSKRRAMKSSVSPGSDSRSTFVFGKVQGESRESDVKRSLGATQDHINKISALHPYVDVSRRAFWSFILCCCATSHPVFTASALDGNEAVYVSGESDFVRTGKGGFGYTFTPPPNFVQSKKPLQTHLDEINFEKKAGDTKINGYVYGITVDPVRIDNLRQFGTPEEVAARVVVAELNRDGILDVRLDSTRDVVLSDSRSHNNSVYYAIEYTSSGKRGIKRVLTRIGIANRMLYVLTAQVKAADFSTSIEREMRDAVDSFSVKIDY